MPYLGNEAADRFVSQPAVDQFSGDGSTTAFTLSFPVTSDQDILVSVDGVVQDVAAYAVSSGTTLTFTAAPSSNSGNNIFVNYLARTHATVAHPATSALTATTGTFTDAVTAASTLAVTGAITANGGVVFNENSADVDFRVEGNGDANLLFVDAGNDRIGIGTNSPTVPFTVKEENSGFQTFLDNDNGSAQGLKVRIKANDSGDFSIFNATSGSTGSDIEHYKIEKNGQIIHYANVADSAYQIQNDGNNNNRWGIRITCGADDASGTNYAVIFRDGDGSSQGSITFSGGTVTYGAFTAHHPCIIPESDNNASSAENAYPYGTLLETISISYTQKDGADTERGIQYNVRKTQSENSKAVLGAYGSCMNGGPDEETNLHQALILGDGHILCNNAGGNIAVGDGICSSATAGIGQKATANPSMIIGIAQEAVTFSSGSETKLVAVQYGLQQFTPWG